MLTPESHIDMTLVIMTKLLKHNVTLLKSINLIILVLYSMEIRCHFVSFTLSNTLNNYDLFCSNSTVKTILL